MIDIRYSSLMILLIITILYPKECYSTGYTLVKELLQNNVAGEPIVHQPTVWDFDPEVSEKRRPLFYELHGFRGSKFIERIGIGIDGKEDERRTEQAERDVGRLNGEHVLNFP